MPGQFHEDRIVFRQVPDLAHVVESHRIGLHFAAIHARFDLNVFVREIHPFVADIFKPLVQRFDLQRRQQVLVREKSLFVELVDLCLGQRH